jgi:hypothetical protein
MAMIELDQEEEHAAVAVAPQEDKVQQVEPKGESDMLFSIDIFLGCTYSVYGRVLGAGQFCKIRFAQCCWQFSCI